MKSRTESGFSFRKSGSKATWSVMIVGYSYGYFDSRDMLRVGLALTVIESALLLLVVPFYWPLIGI